MDKATKRKNFIFFLQAEELTKKNLEYEKYLNYSMIAFYYEREAFQPNKAVTKIDILADESSVRKSDPENRLLGFIKIKLLIFFVI